jgi:hypothetical protein
MVESGPNRWFGTRTSAVPKQKGAFSIGFNTSSIGFNSFSICFNTFVFFGNRLLLGVFNTHFPPLVFLADVGWFSALALL